MMRNNGEKHDAGRGQWALLQQQNTNKQNQTNKGRKAQHVKTQGHHSTHRWIGGSAQRAADDARKEEKQREKAQEMRETQAKAQEKQRKMQEVRRR